MSFESFASVCSAALASTFALALALAFDSEVDVDVGASSVLLDKGSVLSHLAEREDVGEGDGRFRSRVCILDPPTRSDTGSIVRLREAEPEWGVLSVEC